MVMTSCYSVTVLRYYLVTGSIIGHDMVFVCVCGYMCFSATTVYGRINQVLSGWDFPQGNLGVPSVS